MAEENKDVQAGAKPPKAQKPPKADAPAKENLTGKNLAPKMQA
jgi:hypothetical protein